MSTYFKCGITKYLPKELLAKKLHQFSETAKKIIENRDDDKYFFNILKVGK